MTQSPKNAPTIQEIIRRMNAYWQGQGCALLQGYDLEVGAGTFNPITFLRSLGPEPFRAAYVEPSRRPADGRYGDNPNRMQQHHQYQVMLKPSPPDMQELYLRSLEAVGMDLSKHDIRFVHDDWESPTLGAWGLGWEVWSDGMEVTQYTYFQSIGGLPAYPVTGELTYGLERLAMYLQETDNVYDLRWNDALSYGDLFHRNEVEFSTYNFEAANTKMWLRHFQDFEQETKRLVQQNLPLPAYDFVMKASHAFNMLDARRYFSVTERVGYIARIRTLACEVAKSYVALRKQLGFPLLPKQKTVAKPAPSSVFPSSFTQVDPEKKGAFLLEIGSEELPASFVPKGLASLERALRALLKKEKLSFTTLNTYGTPRRLTALIRGLQLKAAAEVEVRRGPPISSAFTEDAPTQAAVGFFRSLGLHQAPSLAAVRSGKVPGMRVGTHKGEEYLFTEQRSKERIAAKILAQALPKLIASLDFPKTMRWGEGEISYARPLRWIIALLDDQVIPFHLDGIESGRTSQGHRQRCNRSFEVDNADNYLQTLRAHQVMADVSERHSSIESQLAALETELNAKALARETLVAQVLHLVEWPTLTWGSFSPSYLELPKEVLISEMVEHQKYFPLANNEGVLLNRFVITADTSPSSIIRRGNEKVLSARLADGAFLYSQDLQKPLEQLNEKLKHITYQKDLGTLWEKVKRLEQHVSVLQEVLDLGDQSLAKRAAKVCKADLASATVGEFPDLQGVIGCKLALAQGENPAIAQAIEEHWMPRKEGDRLPSSALGTLLSLAEKIDTILGCFAVGLKPTSSSDPYALRRQMLAAIRMLIEGQYRLPLGSTLRRCFLHFDPKYHPRQEELVNEVLQFAANRIKTVFLEYDLRKDEIEASLAEKLQDFDIYDTFCQIKALSAFRRSGDAFAKLYEVFKRARGQTEGQESEPFDSSKLQEPAEKALYESLCSAKTDLGKALDKRCYSDAFAAIAQLQKPLDALFTEVHILTEDRKLRTNRIALLQEVFALFSRLLDFTKIQEN